MDLEANSTIGSLGLPNVSGLVGSMRMDSFLQELWDKDPCFLSTIGSLNSSFPAATTVDQGLENIANSTTLGAGPTAQPRDGINDKPAHATATVSRDLVDLPAVTSLPSGVDIPQNGHERGTTGWATPMDHSGKSVDEVWNAIHASTPVSASAPYSDPSVSSSLGYLAMRSSNAFQAVPQPVLVRQERQQQRQQQQQQEQQQQQQAFGTELEQQDAGQSVTRPNALTSYLAPDVHVAALKQSEVQQQELLQQQQQQQQQQQRQQQQQFARDGNSLIPSMSTAAYRSMEQILPPLHWDQSLRSHPMQQPPLNSNCDSQALPSNLSSAAHMIRQQQLRTAMLASQPQMAAQGCSSSSAVHSAWSPVSMAMPSAQHTQDRAGVDFGSVAAVSNSQNDIKSLALPPSSSTSATAGAVRSLATSWRHLPSLGHLHAMTPAGAANAAARNMQMLQQQQQQGQQRQQGYGQQQDNASQQFRYSEILPPHQPGRLQPQLLPTALVMDSPSSSSPPSIAAAAAAAAPKDKAALGQHIPIPPASIASAPTAEAAAVARASRQRKRKIGDEGVKKAPVVKQRMLKNRESAARSRQRKQAYTSELEEQVQLLKTQNRELWERVIAACPAIEAKTTSSDRKPIRRTCTVPF